MDIHVDPADIDLEDYRFLPTSRYARNPDPGEEREEADLIRDNRRRRRLIAETIEIVARDTTEDGSYREPPEITEARADLERQRQRIGILRALADGRHGDEHARSRYLAELKHANGYGPDDPLDARRLAELQYRDEHRTGRGPVGTLQKAEHEAADTDRYIRDREDDYRSCRPTWERWRETHRPVPVRALTPVPPAEQPWERALDDTQRLAWALARDPSRHGRWLALDTGRPLTEAEARVLTRQWRDITVYGHHLEFETRTQGNGDGYRVVIRYTPITPVAPTAGGGSV